MSTISISSKFARLLAVRLISTNVQPQVYTGFRGDQVAGNYRVRFMKGTIPSDFTSLTAPGSRSADVLVTFTPSQLIFDASDHPIVVSSQQVAATASGTASWFWWCTYDGGNVPTQQMIGTIGSSGTDIVIPDSNIVSGQNYSFTNLRFQMPTSFTY